jgi:hypothetical protein
MVGHQEFFSPHLRDLNEQMASVMEMFLKDREIVAVTTCIRYNPMFSEQTFFGTIFWRTNE